MGYVCRREVTYTCNIPYLRQGKTADWRSKASWEDTIKMNEKKHVKGAY
jgi:hypothetical protein